MRTIDYDQKDKNTGNTENRIATDQTITQKFGTLQNAYNEGFGASSGVRGETAETGGRLVHPEEEDDSHPKRTPGSIEDENAGLADS